MFFILSKTWVIKCYLGHLQHQTMTVIIKESPSQNTRYGLNDRICSPEYSIENHMKKIPTGSKVNTNLANMQISWNMKNFMLL